MSTELVPFDDFAGGIPAEFQDSGELETLGAGIGSSFAVISGRGKVWRFNYQGEETNYVDFKSKKPTPDLRVVILGAGDNLSKTYYKDAYVSGNTERPDCSSYNGVVPDPGVPDRQSATCAKCRWNVFGSAERDDGSQGKAKACQENKRLAVVPADDPANELYGGAMLLRVPPASLRGLVRLKQILQAREIPLIAAVVEISFDINNEFPRYTFTPVEVITDPAKLRLLVNVRNNSPIEEMVNGMEFAEDAVAPAPEPEPQKAKPQRKAAPAQRGGSKPKTKKAAAPVANGEDPSPEEQMDLPMGEPEDDKPAASLSDQLPADEVEEAEEVPEAEEDEEAIAQRAMAEILGGLD